MALIRAFRTADGRWHGELDDPLTIEGFAVLPFFPHRQDAAAGSPYAGQYLVAAVGDSPTPPGWTRFLPLRGQALYATAVVCWLLFGGDEPDQWPAA
ncbi:hypothetical protein ACQP2F_16440 [Actinoplanes sp. CA-030573]|uniref:hypothetical protein n=1 Tax=Actinoplanes sp. CA-030573 TaxID=3239898 RepID=UPI003D94C4B1